MCVFFLGAPSNLSFSEYIYGLLTLSSFSCLNFSCTAELRKLELGPVALAKKKYQGKNCGACKGCTTAGRI